MAKSPPAPPPSPPGLVVPDPNIAAVWASYEQLVPWPDNPKQHGDEQLEKIAEVVLRCGWGAVLLARAANREIIAGHGRHKSIPKLVRRWNQASEAERAGFHPDARRIVERREVPVRWLDVTEEQAHTLALADNRIPEDAPVDDAALAAAVAALGAEHASIAGFSDRQILDMLSPEVEAEVSEFPVSELGDRYWISIQGPMPEQPEALARVREVLEQLPEAVITIGTSKK